MNKSFFYLLIIVCLRVDVYSQQNLKHDYYNIFLGKFETKAKSSATVNPNLPDLKYDRYISVIILPGIFQIYSHIKGTSDPGSIDGTYILGMGSNAKSGKLVTNLNLEPIKYFIDDAGDVNIEIIGFDPPKVILKKTKTIFEIGDSDNGFFSVNSILSEGDEEKIEKQQKDILGTWLLRNDNHRISALPKTIEFDKDLKCYFDSTFTGNWKINKNNDLLITSENSAKYNIFHFNIANNKIKLTYFFDDIGRISLKQNNIDIIYEKRKNISLNVNHNGYKTNIKEESSNIISKNSNFENYKGAIDGKYEITMKLYFINKKITGNYFYNKHNIKINVEGTISEKNEIEMNGYEDGILIDIFKGKLLSNGNIKGTWYKPNNIKNASFF